MNIKCIIIDDEPTAQTVLKTFISEIDFLELVAVCDNAIEALQILKQNNTIDLLFLDINMPKISGLAFYKSLQNPPEVIFTTAYSEHAVQGFELNAIDYLLKPFSFDRFFTAVNKVLDKKVSTQHPKKHKESIIIKSNKVLHKIDSNTIMYVEALGDYVKIHLKDKHILTNSTFSKLLNTLTPYGFIRTHKSFAVPLDKINRIDGNRVIIETYTIPIGQTYKVEFLEKFNQL